MNRRSFFRTLAAATAGFTILPPATTYSRIWKATRTINPEWVNAPFEVSFISHDPIFDPRIYAGTWRFIRDEGNLIEVAC